jgi:hypothetical protein
MIFQRLTNWLQRRRLTSAAHASAWRSAAESGADGLTNFQRLALTTLEPVTGPLALRRSGIGESYLVGSISGADLVLYLYLDGAQIHGTKHRFIAEKWDYDSPSALIDGLVSFVSARLQSNNAFESGPPSAAAQRER